MRKQSHQTRFAPLLQVGRRSAQNFVFSLPTAPFLNPNISDAEARLAGDRLHHAGVGSQIHTFARMDAMAYDKTAKSERFPVENLEAGCIILVRPTAP